MTMAVRKLQAEIDRTLKTVSQGVETFEMTFDKLNHATNATQKDKVENDLKTQIKKLQRLRDQIKAWLGNNDIKDKTALYDSRKLIETQMERFKALEKEMKMKAFSKEGLIAQSRLDPAEKAKRDIIDWIGTTVEELSRQVEQTEAEAETLQTGKKKKGQGDRLHELDELNERRTWHTGRLEVVQRMLENGQLSVEQVETIQDDINYFVEANGEEDFDYDVGIYDELNLQDDEDYVQDFPHHDELSNLDSSSIADTNPEPPVAAPPKTPAKEEKEKKATPVNKATKETTDEQPPSPVAAKRQPSRKSTMEIKVAPSPVVEKNPAKTDAPAPKAAPLPPIRYAAAAAAAVAPSSVPSVPAPNPADSSPAKSKTEPPVLSPTSITEEPRLAESVLQSQPQVSHTNGHVPPPPGLVPSPAPPAVQSSVSGQSSDVASPSTTAPSQTLANGPSIANASSVPPGHSGLSNPPHAESSRAASAFSGASPRPAQGVLGNLMQSFDIAKEISERRGGDFSEVHAALDGSFANAPLQIDGEPPRYYHPKNPIKTPSYYPQVRAPILDDRSLYSRFETDQLFYIFYYMTGTYEQWLAAQELKKQSWRFHKQYLTWFQRAHNPQAITEDYEQGGYFYFDWENSWCQRKKSDFRFEYRWLSEH
ncbi:Not1 N-terminal domain, CCR4-Not complex component-domain-containing protein [Papiliotrema laurentii]|uniref:General negative regulator of transcription subunit n=1 Tax=Papiliotrema laurentii TaxID=5418 RepID=A0AAD9FQD3_PAPLA|nr:Not1 N-terminal domain, CCR4-Not complex component-domain-containing protein [Papiliotrema laurentii]